MVKDDMGLSWSRCASEGEDCSCESGTVRFGLSTRWVVNDKAAKRLTCNAQSFNGLDPAEAQTKECWCQLAPAPGTPPPANPSDAIVLLSRRAPDLKTWLQYHVEYMGVKHVFMDVEDSPDFDKDWQALPEALRSHVTVWKQPASTSGDK